MNEVKKTILIGMLACFALGFIAGTGILIMIQHEVCSEISGLMNATSSYKVLGGCRWNFDEQSSQEIEGLK